MAQFADKMYEISFLPEVGIVIFMAPFSEILACLGHFVVGVCEVVIGFFGGIGGIRGVRAIRGVCWLTVLVVQVRVWVFGVVLGLALIEWFTYHEIIVFPMRSIGFSLDIGWARLLLVSIEDFLGHLIDGFSDRIILILQILKHFVQFVAVEQIVIHGVDRFHGRIEFFVMPLLEKIEAVVSLSRHSASSYFILYELLILLQVCLASPNPLYFHFLIISQLISFLSTQFSQNYPKNNNALIQRTENRPKYLNRALLII